ncbi:hypothetical protein AB0K05_28940 [Nonomuraea sp. NPDC049486]|uniref:hypothetical protein n=1 Tax=Nonomuraea sp. NPDC049486 TaxID=3155773 RepID=UPI0034195DAF
MRRLATVLLTLSLAACGPSAPAPQIGRPSPVAAVTGPTLSCGSAPVGVAAMPVGTTRSGTFRHVRSLTRKLKVRGETWSRGAERLHVGVVCGVRTAEEFATLVGRATLGMHHGKPALSWETRGDLHNFMWLERPGTAVYVAATPGLSTEIDRIADEVTG